MDLTTQQKGTGEKILGECIIRSTERTLVTLTKVSKSGVSFPFTSTIH